MCDWNYLIDLTRPASRSNFPDFYRYETQAHFWRSLTRIRFEKCDTRKTECFTSGTRRALQNLISTRHEVTIKMGSRRKEIVAAKSENTYRNSRLRRSHFYLRRRGTFPTQYHCIYFTSDSVKYIRVVFFLFHRILMTTYVRWLCNHIM